ncbi:MAG: aminotransferase class III-fold pyridoxal phosphate-dependent enzyme [Mariniblastus sp.]
MSHSSTDHFQSIDEANPAGDSDNPRIDFELAELTGRQIHRARQLFAYGGLDGVMNRPLMHDQGLYPHFAVAANGYELYDSSGQTFVDWINGWGSIILGHCHDTVQQAIVDQAKCATSIALMHPVEIEVAELVVEMVPNAEMIAFGKNGSDSLNAAIRIARAATGRELILQNGFHGFHDWYTCLHPNVQGVLPALKNYVQPFPYNDLEALESLLKQHQGQFAGIVMEPVNLHIPDQGYLQSVKELVHKYGGVLIWDEVVTAFRLGRGGAQQYFGVEPDIAVLGKAMGNGLPLSAVVGSAELMKHLRRTAYGMTYRGETISLAAANACLRFMKQNDVAGHLEMIGSKLRDRFHELCQEIDIHCKLSGPSARMSFVFQAQGGLQWQAIRSIFVLECLKNGVLTNGNILVSYAHDDEAIDRTILAFEKSLKRVRSAIDASGMGVRTGTEFAFDASSVEIKGCVDAVQRSPEQMIISGWALVDGVVIDGLFAAFEDGTKIKSEINPRPDIGEAFPAVENGANAGFKITIPKNSNGATNVRFRLIGKVGSVERFHCLVVDETSKPSSKNQPPIKGPHWFRDGVLFI